jgi:hypothetical protein
MIKSLSKRARVALVAFALVAGTAGSAAADWFTSVVFATEYEWPALRSYEQHAASWWRWALTKPVSTSPLLDTTGANCQVGQSGSVFYLAGTFDGSAVTRRCSISRGKTIIVPVANGAYLAWPKDSAAEHTEDFLRSVTACMAEDADLYVELDGHALPNPEDYLEFSTAIASKSTFLGQPGILQLPADNVFGETDPTQTKFDGGYDTGYYVAIRPYTLSVGTHTLRFGGSTACAAQDNTYILSITN